MMMPRNVCSIALLAGLALSAAPAAAEDTKSLEACYQAYGQLETTAKGGKKVTVYKDQAEVAAECNAKVVARAKTLKTKAEVLELAGVIGRNSNWQSAMPVYARAAALDPGVCVDKDPLETLDLALESPVDHPHAAGARAFMAACWSASKESKDRYVKLLRGASSLKRANVCSFLQARNGRPKDKLDACAARLRATSPGQPFGLTSMMPPSWTYFFSFSRIRASICRARSREMP
jgi:hypothetical protein